MSRKRKRDGDEQDGQFILDFESVIQSAEVQTREQQVISQESRTSDLAKRVDELTIRAPFDGMVTEKMVDPGNIASPGVPLLRLEDTRGFRLEVRVDQSRTSEIHQGDSVPVFLGTATTAIQAPFILHGGYGLRTVGVVSGS